MTLADTKPGDVVSIAGWSNHLLVDYPLQHSNLVRVDEIAGIGSLGDKHWLHRDTIVATVASEKGVTP